MLLALRLGQALLVSAMGLAAADGVAAETPSPVSYQLDVIIEWSAETHPDGFPDKVHLTRIIGAVHHARYRLFHDGHTASSGLESVAERGRTAILEAELVEQMARGRIGAIIEAPALDPVPGEFSISLQVTDRHYLVSFVTMIAPSPDWFTGAVVDLRNGDGWRDTVTVPLFMWDAGTADGETFTERTGDTQPRESVRLLLNPNVVSLNGVKPIGRAVFRRQQD